MEHGTILKAIRLSHNIARDRLSYLTGMSKARILSFERNTNYPSYQELQKMSEVFSFPMECDHFFKCYEICGLSENTKYSYLFHKMPNAKGIAKAVKDGREAKGLSQLKFAKMSKVSKSLIFYMEAERRVPKLKRLCRVCNNLNEKLYYAMK